MSLEGIKRYSTDLLEKGKYKYNQISFHNRYLVKEFIIRLEIYSEIIDIYIQKKIKHKKNQLEKELIIPFYKPAYIVRFYGMFMPIYFFNSNIVLSFISRKETPLFRLTTFTIFNLLSIYVFFFYLDKKLFMQYISKNNTYSGFMRKEFLKRKDSVSPKSFEIVENLELRARDLFQLD